MKVAVWRPLVVVGALLIVAGLFARWTQPADTLVLFGAADRLPDTVRSGWEELAWLDVALVGVAALLAASAVVRVPPGVAGAAAVVAAALVLVSALGDRDAEAGPLSLRDGEVRMYAEMEPAVLGPALTLAGLGVALVALILRGR